jgi:hypothetical protein
MESTNPANKYSAVNTVNADNFFENLENGGLANIIRNNHRALEAWTHGRNTPDRNAPEMHELLIVGTPGVAGVAAVVADPGADPPILAVDAVVAVPAIADFHRFGHTSRNELSAAGEREYRSVLEKYYEHLETDTRNNSTTMQSFINSYTPDLQRLVREHNPVLFSRCLTDNLLWDLTILTQQALRSTNLNTASQVLTALLHQAPPPRTDNLHVDLSSQTLRTLTNNVTNVFGADVISVNQLAVQGFLRSLCPIRDSDFISWFNDKYPTGICNDVYVIFDRYKILTLAKSTDRVMLDNSEASHLTFKRDEQDLLAFIARADKTHGTAKLETLLVRCLNTKMLAPRLHALLAPKGQKRSTDSTPRTDSKPDGKTEPAPTQPKACVTCKAMFVPTMSRHVTCPTCFKKSLNKALHTADPPAESDQDIDIAGKFAFSARGLSTGALTPSTTEIPCFWDNGSSVNLTSDLSLLEQINDLAEPFYLGGPSSKFLVTKIGIMPALPAPKNIAYYSTQSQVTLLSLGNWCANGGMTKQDCDGLKVYDVSGPIPVLFDSAPALADNLSPVNPTIWKTRRSGINAPCTRWASTFNADYVALPSTQLLYSELASYHSAADPAKHYTARQLLRANEVERLHFVYVHINDHDLGVMLDTGLIVSPLHCTSHDVAINRVLRLNCPQCLEGKMRKPHYGDSTAPPSENVGEALQLDLEMNPVPAASGGATHSVMIVDSHTGEIGIVPADDKTGPSILHATLKYINSHYRAHGHATLRLSADAESVFKSMIPLFGKAGYILTLMPPQQHAQQLERYQQTLLNRYIAVLASCPFYFPLKYQSQLRSAVAYSMSLCPNSLTSPSTPFVLRTGARQVLHPLADHLRIGSTCMVLCGKAARDANALASNQTAKSSPRSELGVCLGPSQETPGAYNFILENGKIVPRHILSIVNVIPFNWKARPVLRSYLDSSATQTLALPKAPLPAPPIVFPPSVTDPVPPQSSTDFGLDPSVLDAVQAPPRDPNSPAVRVLRHTGDITDLDDCEFLIEYEDGDRRWDWHINFGNWDTFKDYVYTQRQALKKAQPPPSPPLVRPPVPLATRSSTRHIPTPPVPDALGWTLITQGPSSTLHPRTTRSPQLPSQLELLFESDPDDIEDALPRLPPPSLSAPSFDTISDLDWYSPTTSAIPVATATEAVPWTLEQEPLPATANFTFAKAYAIDPVTTMEALNKEMDKYFVHYDVCRSSEAIAYKDIPAGALKQFNRIFFTQTFVASGAHKKFKGRCITDGKRQPPDTYYDTYAAVSATTDKFATVAAYNAAAKALGWDLQIFNFDITAFFLQNGLTDDNSPVACYIRMPTDIPHWSAGKWFPRHATTYGSKNANNIADNNLHALLISIGFFPNPEAPRTYSKFDPSDPRISCTVNMHVDDGNGCSFCPAFVAELRSALEKRYGPLEWDSEASSHTGYRLQRYTDGSLSLDQSGHIARMLSDLGASNLPFVSKPSLDDFFDPPTNLTPINKKYYQHLIGNVVYCMNSKTNLQKEMQYLSTRQSAPVQSDLDKIIRLLAYMHHHNHEHIRFSGTDYQVHLWCDASYGTHPDGRSHDGYFITVGENNGAICSHSAKQAHCVAQGSMEAEYVALTPGVKRALHFRRLLHAMGFPQTGPIVIHEDNKSAINLASSHQIPRNSQHIHVRYHFIRDLVASGIVRFVYTATVDMIADLLTKTLPLGPMQRFTRLILNLSSTPLVPVQAGSLSSA